MKPPVFEYERPANVRAALDALSKHGSKAKLLAGGHSLVPMLNLRRVAPGRLIDVSRLTELQYIIEEYGQLRIGALTTHNTILRSPVVAAGCPIMVEAYQHVANHSIRNRGTIGGNLCHNDPAFEIPLVVTLLGGSMVARSARSSRTIAAERFFKAPFATDLAADEMLIEIRVPRLPARPRLFVPRSQPAFRRSRAYRGRLSHDDPLRHLPRRPHRLSQYGRQRVPNSSRGSRARGQARFCRYRRGGRGRRGWQHPRSRRFACRRSVSPRRHGDLDPADAAHRLRPRRPADRRVTAQ